MNVSDCIPNTFEESKTLKMTYKKINIQDNEDVPIHHSFNLAYNFIDNAICPKNIPKNRSYQTKFDILQQFKDTKKQSATQVYSAARSNDVILDLKKMTSTDVPNEKKDKMYEIDIFSEKQNHNSYNQHRVLVH